VLTRSTVPGIASGTLSSMETSEKVRENRLRRMAYRRSLHFCKSRLRDPAATGYGKVRIETADGIEAEGFESPDGHGLTLDEVERRLDDGRWARYRLYAAGDVLLYVGSSNNPRGRWSELSTNYWWPQVERKDVTWYATKREARAAEAQSVLSESPVHNVRLRSSDLTAVVAVRMTPHELAEIDAARGQVSRCEWLRRLLLGAEPRQSGEYSISTLPPAAGGCQQPAAPSAPSRPYAEARAAITGDSWLDDLARASVSAAETKFTPVAAAASDVPAKRRKPASHRCPAKGWCQICGEWKGAKR
jgi:hypothetical protein